MLIPVDNLIYEIMYLLPMHSLSDINYEIETITSYVGPLYLRRGLKKGTLKANHSLHF